MHSAIPQVSSWKRQPGPEPPNRQQQRVTAIIEWFGLEETLKIIKFQPPTTTGCVQLLTPCIFLSSRLCHGCCSHQLFTAPGETSADASREAAERSLWVSQLILAQLYYPERKA
ncbi:hypothetical protein llap_4445 [Limosa lapponica baueri]|uniref:Uncharacterized protein n=1 Tax=Limosa lapponica baueri TaxID=1758121 RepID=A0A2I0UGT6_LIMLA|nr:hypothetical protein llap_4445 [Limosa lapponica baueri]